MGYPEPVMTWRKSSRSSAQAECVEVAMGTGGVAVRDSKDVTGGHLSVSGAQWRAFVAGLRAGSFESPER